MNPPTVAEVYGMSIVVVLLAWVAYRVWAGRWSPVAFFEGADGRPSTSKFQFFIWTLAVLWAYIVLFTVRLLAGLDPPALPDVPTNLMIAMGLTIATAATAKGITTSYVASGQIVKPPAPASAGVGALIQDDTGFPDLSKAQMLGWTGVALLVFLTTVHLRATSAVDPQNWPPKPPTSAQGTGTKPGSHPLALPDIDAALMVLMGLGQGAYLGKKLVTTTTPRLTGLTPVHGAPPTAIVLTGEAFGATQNDSLIVVDGVPLPITVGSWTDARISFTLPAVDAAGQPWTPPGRTLTVSVIVSGQASANTMPFTVV